MIKVYASGDARSRRVLWALEELDAPYDVVELTFPPVVHHPEFLDLNPAGGVPAIEDDGRVLIESLAICEHLNHKFGGDLVLQADEPGRLDYLQLLHFGESTLAVPMGWVRRFGSDPANLAQARGAYAQRLKVIERALADGREYLAAGRLTLADLSVCYAIGLSRTFGQSDLLTPSVVAYEQRLKARPAYQRAYAR